MKIFQRPLLIICLISLLSACGTVSSGYYRVASGDTLYKIARKKNVSIQQLVQWNQLQDPNKLRKGQLLRVEASTSKKATASNKRTHAYKNSKKATSNPSFVITEPPENIRLIWPTQGKVIEKYSDLSKGINITNQLGTPIYAAANGQVVYAGNGLRGYGNLVIIKHEHRFLTAYAHNRIILVKEGQTVSQGQKIAEMGSTDSQRVMLHFELRYDGRSLNPIVYLPAQ